ncbi:hypothetical protein BDV95DRAFT_603977 [Massariosphaeria phaeospora]|uniref:Uncharacterized protein n=1 Tax=Massariosphaeria phaeospora TaxID=100035 RepID=A0A7C8MD03_9PLEO|nr:hypothetical protein BDV95DRAFT_603977 [Massariosphaeria phaeospora]
MSSYSSTPRSSIDLAKANFTTSTASLTSSPSSTKSLSVAKKAWAAIKKHAKEHHESVNASPDNASSTTPSKPPNKARRIWEKIKSEHKEMNAAYATYYGQGQMNGPVNSSRKPKVPVETVKRGETEDIPVMVGKAAESRTEEDSKK